MGNMVHKTSLQESAAAEQTISVINNTQTMTIYVAIVTRLIPKLPNHCRNSQLLTLISPSVCSASSIIILIWLMIRRLVSCMLMI